jgi:hypothetical protein
MIVTKENFDETRYRAKLGKTIDDYGHLIGEAPYVCWTGKGGKIEYEVAFIKEMLRTGHTFNEEFVYEE